MQYHYVYRVTNLLTSEFYIGCRSSDCTPEKDIGYWGSSLNMNKRIVEKYGIINFKKEIIKGFESRSKANSFEVEQIKDNFFSCGTKKKNPLLINDNPFDKHDPATATQFAKASKAYRDRLKEQGIQSFRCDLHKDVITLIKSAPGANDRERFEFLVKNYFDKTKNRA